jgi:NADH-ubiquinone oxidoreductase chain 5
VTAGVYLILRFYYLVYNLFQTKLIGLFFLVTTLLAGLVACFEPDLKKVVAISTLSQLGLMLFILSLGDLIYCYYHIVCHALFKALLFLRCGMIINLRIGGQDMRFMGGLGYYLPGVGVMLGVSNLSLVGFPFFAGFYSKDGILERTMYFEEYIFYFLILVFCCILTAIYSFKLFKIRMTSVSLRIPIRNFNEKFQMLVGMTVLSF